MTGARERFEVGTTVYKEYINPDAGKPKVHTGRVESYKQPFYRIIYEEDGDMEDMTHAEVAKYARRQTNSAKRYQTTRGYTRAVNSILFQQGEKVLCYEPDPSKEKLLYEAKIIGIRDGKEDCGKRRKEYFVNCIGR